MHVHINYVYNSHVHLIVFIDLFIPGCVNVYGGIYRDNCSGVHNAFYKTCHESESSPIGSVDFCSFWICDILVKRCGYLSRPLSVVQLFCKLWDP